MFKQIDKYSISHPLITPEFFIPELTSTHKVKSLAIYDNKSLSPDILYDKPINAIDHVIGSNNFFNALILHPNYHMYINDYPSVSNLPANLLATQLYRMSLLSSLGITSYRIIYGPVILFGSVSAYTKQNDGEDYSVPYELIEQVIRLYKVFNEH